MASWGDEFAEQSDYFSLFVIGFVCAALTLIGVLFAGGPN